jgi:predicted transcriptional regulator
MKKLDGVLKTIGQAPDMSYNEWIKHMGSELRSLRLESGMTQLEVAKKTGLSEPYVSRIESGRFNFTMKMLKKLLEI